MRSPSYDRSAQFDNFKRLQDASLKDDSMPDGVIMRMRKETYTLQVATGKNDGTDNIVEIMWVNSIGIETGFKSINGSIDNNLDPGTIYIDESFSGVQGLENCFCFVRVVEVGSYEINWFLRTIMIYQPNNKIGKWTFSNCIVNDGRWVGLPPDNIV